ncbi:MAG: type III ribulose-bisphosphate carboxylase [Thermoplasmatota archaeon]
MQGMGYRDFIDLGYRPGPDDVTCVFRVVPRKGTPFEFVAGALAAESSIGTWDPGLATVTEAARKLGARVYKMDEATGEVHVAYPLALFEIGSLPQLLSSVVGNVYGLKEVEKLRFVDCEFPEKYARGFKGPQVGLDGVRKMTGVKVRPLFGTIVKPKLGLTADEWAEAAYRAWKGGLDIVKDDENLTSMTFNDFYKRAEKVVAKKKQAERETGERKIYFSNVSAPYSEMKKRADFVTGLGNEYVMIDILTVGWSAVQDMRDHLEGKGTAIHAHRAMHGAMTKLEEHGVDFLPMAKWARLAGCDNLHAGTAGAGKMFVEGGVKHARRIYDFLRSDWHGLKKTIPVASGGLHPGVVPLLVATVGTDFAATFGGGVHGHPKGSEAGARAVRQALDATMEGITLAEYAKTHAELAVALEKWGTGVVGGSE